MNGYTEKRSNRCEDGSNEQKKKCEEEKTRTGTLQYGYPKPFIGRSGVVSVEKGEKKGRVGGDVGFTNLGFGGSFLRHLSTELKRHVSVCHCF